LLKGGIEEKERERERERAPATDTEQVGETEETADTPKRPKGTPNIFSS
jgi:hypothetical protein